MFSEIEGGSLSSSNFTPIEEQKEASVKAYERATLVTVGEFSEPQKQVFSIRFDPTQKYIAAGMSSVMLGFTDLTIRVYNINTGKVGYILKADLPVLQDMPVTSIRWRPEGSGMVTQNVLTACYANGTLLHWHVTSGKVLHTFHTEEPLYCLDYNYAGDTFAASGKQPSINIYDEPKKALKLTLREGSRERAGHWNRIFSLRFDDLEPNLLVSGGWDQIVNLWDLRTGKAELQMLGPYVCGDSIDIKCNKLMVGSYRTENVLQIYDKRKFKKEANIPWNFPDEEETGRVYSCKFNRVPLEKLDFILAAGAHHNEVKLFDANSPTYSILASVQGLPRSILDTDVSPKSNMIAFGGADGSVKLMKVVEVEDKTEVPNSMGGQDIVSEPASQTGVF